MKADSDDSKSDSKPPFAEGELSVETSAENAVLTSLQVEIAVAPVRRAFDRAYRELARSVKVRGFRPGKVPRSVLERLYGASVREEIERTLVAASLEQALAEAELTPVSEPGIEAEPPESGQPFRYRAGIETRPTVELPELAGLPAQRPAVQVTDEDLDRELEQLRARNTPLVEEPEKTPAAQGHLLTVDYVGRVDGEVFEGGTAQDAQVEIGAGRLVEGFEEALVGALAGDDREIEVSFPDDYAAEALRGKQATFAVHISAIKRREPPELDDEFAKDVGDFESLAELRERIHDDLQKGRESEAEEVLRRSVMDSLVERTEFDVPPRVVERQLQSQLDSMRRQFEGHVPPEALERQLARMQEDGRPAAERRVREGYLLHAVAELRDISATDEDVDTRLGEMAEAQGVEADKLRAAAKEQGWLEAIRAELVDRKALDFLAAEAKVEQTTGT